MRNLLPRTILHLASIAEPTASLSDLDSNLHSLFLIVKTLSRWNDHHQPAIDLWIATAGSHAVHSSEHCRSAGHAAMWGLALVTNREIPWLHCRCLDLPEALEPAGDLAELVLRTVALQPDRVEFAIRAGQLLVRSYRPYRPSGANAPALKQGGTYLITGGLGGIGRELAKWLVNKYAARLVLVTRGSPQNKPVEAEPWFKRKDILICRADVCDLQALSDAFNLARARFGSVNGIFHAAAVIRKARIQDTSWPDFEEVLRPKLLGTCNLLELATNEQPDFVVLFSSIASLIGNVFQADYSAANRALDSLAAAGQARGIATISIAWDLWQNIGMARAKNGRADNRNEAGLSADQGLSALELALASARESTHRSD